MDTTCRICHKLTLDQRADIEQRVVAGDSYMGIERDYPGITRYVIYKHMKHAADPKHEADIQGQRLAREMLAEKLKNFDYQPVVSQLRERLACVLIQSQEIVEDVIQDVQLEVKTPDDLVAVLYAQQKILANLDTITGLKKLVNIDAAFSLLLTEGYTISTDKK